MLDLRFIPFKLIPRLNLFLIFPKIIVPGATDHPHANACSSDLGYFPEQNTLPPSRIIGNNLFWISLG